MAELQADEIRTVVEGKEQPIWVFVVRVLIGLAKRAVEC